MMLADWVLGMRRPAPFPVGAAHLSRGAAGLGGGDEAPQGAAALPARRRPRPEGDALGAVQANAEVGRVGAGIVLSDIAAGVLLDLGGVQVHVLPRFRLDIRTTVPSPLSHESRRT